MTMPLTTDLARLAAAHEEDGPGRRSARVLRVDQAGGRDAPWMIQHSPKTIQSISELFRGVQVSLTQQCVTGRETAPIVEDFPTAEAYFEGGGRTRPVGGGRVVSASG
jgi:hypothetical protein